MKALWRVAWAIGAAILAVGLLLFLAWGWHALWGAGPVLAPAGMAGP